MDNNTIITRVGLAECKKKSRLPARLDLLQSLSGLLLALFMILHMMFVATILVSPELMWQVTKFFEGYHLFGKSYPWIVSIVAAVVLFLFVLHAALAIRKFPISYQQYVLYRAHMKSFKHSDTSLWMWQVITGFALFFLASAHIYQMMVWPELIGPAGSGDRVWSYGLWPYYLLMLLAVETHASVGLYRLIVKWCAVTNRVTLQRIKWGFGIFMLLLGLATLGAYMKVGYEHRDRVGEPYQPVALYSISQEVLS